jgi:glyoxylase-like metal-dependent hydrolase (beta-lactamase superfamily II)
VFDELAAGVYRRRYQSLDLNIGVIVSDSGALVIDTRSTHVEADELRGEIATLTGLPILWVVDTHWHWDHAFGNARFPEAQIWGHRLCRVRLLELGEAMKKDAAAWLPDQRSEIDEVVITPPTELFTETATIDMGSIAVELSYHGLGHTDADIAISVDGGRIVFLGDLVEEGSPPVFSDGYPLSWPGTLRSAIAGGPELVVPGHGDVMSPSAISAQLAELERVAELGRLCISGELEVEDAIRDGPYPEEFMRDAVDRALATGR